MANLTVTEGLLFCRQLYADTDTTDAALSGTELVRIFNEKYLRWHEAVEPRYRNGALILTSAGVYAATTTNVNIADIGLCLCNNGVTNSALERIQLHEFWALEPDAATPAQPTKIALKREGTDTEASIGKWTAYLYPPPDGGYIIKAELRLVPALLTVSGETSTDQPDVSDEAAYTLWRLTAAEAARIIGDDQLVPGILQPVPEHVLSSMNMTNLATIPRAAPGKRAA